MIAQLDMPTNSLSSTLRIPGLEKEAKYSITLLDKPDNFNDIVNCQPLWTQDTLTCSGDWLAKAGLAVPVMDPETALLIKLEIIE